MRMNSEQMEVIRKRAAELIAWAVPFKYGDAKSKSICVGYQPGKGTTCGFLCHWLMWKLGVSDAARVNWTDPDRGLKSMAGENIIRIYRGGASPFVTVSSTAKGVKLPNPMVTTGARPRLGDICFLYEPSGPQETEHVFVFMREEEIYDEVTWYTAEAGQPGAKGSTDSMRRMRGVLIPEQRDRPTFMNESGDTDFRFRRTNNRALIGWLDLGGLDYVDTALADAARPLSEIV